MNNNNNLSLVKNKEIKASDTFFKEFSKLIDLYNEEKISYLNDIIKELNSKQEFIDFIGDSYHFIFTALLEAKNTEIDGARKYSSKELAEIVINHINQEAREEIEFNEKFVFKYKIEGIINHTNPNNLGNIDKKQETKQKEKLNIESINKKAEKSEKHQDFFNSFTHYLNNSTTNKELYKKNIESINIDKLDYLIQKHEEYKLHQLAELILYKNFTQISNRCNIEKIEIILRQSEYPYLKLFIKSIEKNYEGEKIIDKIIGLINKINPNILSYIINQTPINDLLGIIESNNSKNLINMVNEAQSYNLVENLELIKEEEKNIKESKPKKKIDLLIEKLISIFKN